MTPEQTANLTNLFMLKRTELGLSMNEIARLSQVDPSTMWRIEQGMVVNPSVEKLIAIANVLGVNSLELFTTIGWLTAEDLPDVNTYLNAKFPGLSNSTVKDIEHYVDTAIHGRNHHSHPTPSSRGCSRQTNHCPQCPCAPKEC